MSSGSADEPSYGTTLTALDVVLDADHGGLPAGSQVLVGHSEAKVSLTPFNATANPKRFELSSIFQPAMFAAAVPMLVTSNQSTRGGSSPSSTSV